MRISVSYARSYSIAITTVWQIGNALLSFCKFRVWLQLPCILSCNDAVKLLTCQCSKVQQTTFLLNDVCLLCS